MERKNVLRYGVVLLDPTASSMPSSYIKLIMRDKKVCSCDGIISVYAPYKAINRLHHAIWSPSKLWGIGFSLSALKDKVRYDGKPYSDEIVEVQEYDDLKCCRLRAKELTFKERELQSGDVFIIAPSRKQCEGVWFSGIKDGKYKKWWCKGIYDDSTHQWDDDVYRYLESKTFCWKNYSPSADEIPSSDSLITNAGKKLGHHYRLINLTPKELDERGSNPDAIFSWKLF